MNTARVSFAVLVLLAACGKDEVPEAKPIVPAPVTFANGSRLHATFYEVDGVKLLLSWYDTRLGKQCAFQERRCLPGTTRIEQESLALFDDDACTSRVARMSESSAFGGAFDQIVFVDGSPRCRENRLHVRGERVTPPVVYRRNGDNGTCEEVVSGGEFVRVGPELGPDDTTFVRAKEENGPGPGRIVPRWRVADDGAREIIGAWDTERNEAVSAGASITSGKRWMPSEYVVPVGESTCPGVAASNACTPTAVFIGGGGCREPEIFALGPAVDKAACPSAYGTAYAIASKIPESVFADATRVVVGGGRVRLEMFATIDPIFPGGFFDMEARSPCAVAIHGDVMRCQPAGDSRAMAAFGDEGCSQPAILWMPSSSNCDASPDVPHFLSLNGAALVEVGARIFAAWTGTPGACTSVPLLEDTFAYAVTPLDPARLPIVVQRTD
jgi:hypothetical protein